MDTPVTAHATARTQGNTEPAAWFSAGFDHCATVARQQVALIAHDAAQQLTTAALQLLGVGLVLYGATVGLARALGDMFWLATLIAGSVLLLAIYSVTWWKQRLAKRRAIHQRHAAHDHTMTLLVTVGQRLALAAMLPLLHACRTPDAGKSPPIQQ